MGISQQGVTSEQFATVACAGKPVILKLWLVTTSVVYFLSIQMFIWPWIHTKLENRPQNDVRNSVHQSFICEKGGRVCKYSFSGDFPIFRRLNRLFDHGFVLSLKIYPKSMYGSLPTIHFRQKLKKKYFSDGNSTDTICTQKCKVLAKNGLINKKAGL